MPPSYHSKSAQRADRKVRIKLFHHMGADADRVGTDETAAHMQSVLRGAVDDFNRMNKTTYVLEDVYEPYVTWYIGRL